LPNRARASADRLAGIIGLPPNLFYGTGIPACIIVLDKEHAATRKGIFIVDASKGFIKDGNKNRLRAQDIHKIVDVFTRQAELPRYSRMVPLSEIEANDYNLNLPRYIDSTEPEDLQDIDGHLRGGIPTRDIDALDAYWQVFSGMRAALFASTRRRGYSRLVVPVDEIRLTIIDHAEFRAFHQSVTKLFDKWKKSHTMRLMSLAAGDKPRELIDTLSESLLEIFRAARLIDAYDVYQRLMDYWAEAMQDDVYMIVSDGWLKAAKPQPIIEDKKNKEKADFSIGKQKFKAELISPSLLIARYFASEQAAIETIEAELSAVEQRQEELREEHGGDEGLLSEVIENGKIAKAAMSARLKETKDDRDAADEREVLQSYLALVEKEAAAKKKVKQAANDLEAKIAAKYAELTEAEIKSLVVGDKWLATLAAAVRGELNRVSQVLTGRVRELAERYATPLPQIVDQVETLSARVKEHLEKMGAIWH
jgi:type I restriction enzyme M protein